MDDDSDSKPRLLVVKGTFEQFGGAERDLLNNLEAWQAHFEITVVSLNLPSQARERLDSLGILYLTPPAQWIKPTGAWSEFRARASRQASHRWWIMLELTEQGLRMQDVVATSDAVHITSGVGSLEFSQLVPPDLPIHYHCLEPHRGLHEDVLHLEIDGTPKQSLALTRFLLGKQRRIDILLTHGINDRSNGCISGNSKWIQERIQTVYGIEAGLLLPSVDIEVWRGDCPAPEDFVVAIGAASWVKGTFDTVDMLAGTGLALHHVGGGEEADLHALEQHAASRSVELVIHPRLDQSDLVSLVKRARAVVSLARGEPFGLTPIEAQAAGTPALMVDEGGYRFSIEDGVSGRLLARGDWKAWHAALAEAMDPATREAWSQAGSPPTPKDQADALQSIISILR